MQEYLGVNIKEIIQSFPAVGEILERHKIACVSCGVGTCRLQDIIEIHNLPEEEERELMSGIARVLYPDREIEIPRLERKRDSGALKYSPPVKKLVDEHKLIKRLLALIPRLTEELAGDEEAAYQSTGKVIEFIRSFADRFHHAKEEDVLFTYCDESAEIFRVMRLDHETARGYVRALGEALERRDSEGIARTLSAYRELLAEHIKKEDEVLYPWIDRNLTITEVGELFSRFREIDSRFGDVPQQQEAFITDLESKLSPPRSAAGT